MLGFVLLVTACQEGPSPDLMSVGPQLEPAIRAAHTTAAARIAYDRLTSVDERADPQKTEQPGSSSRTTRAAS